MNRRGIAAAFSTGAAIAIPAIARGDYAAAVISAVVGAFLFGFGLELLRRSARAKLRALGDLPTEIPVRPVLTLIVAGDRDRVVEIISARLLQLTPNVDVTAITNSESSMIAKVPRSLRSGSGEVITVSVIGNDNGFLQVEIASRPVSSGTLVDLGRNFAHVQSMRVALAEALGEAAIRTCCLTEAR